MNIKLFNFVGFLSEVWEWVCSHGQAHQYLIESLQTESKNFTARVWNGSIAQAENFIWEDKCDPTVDENCVEMGYNAINYKIRGQFFTVTSRQMPYSGKKIFNHSKFEKNYFTIIINVPIFVLFTEPNEKEKKSVSKFLKKLKIENLFNETRIKI